MDLESLDENAQNQSASSDDVSIEKSMETKEEPQVPQKKLDEIVGKARKAGYEKGRRDALSELESQMSQQQAEIPPQVTQEAIPQASPVSPQIGMGGMSQLNEEALRAMIADETRKTQENILQSQMQKEQQQAAHSLVQEFLGKMALGNELYPDFEQTVKSLELDKIPEIVHLANSSENTAEMMYELAKNPSKIANLGYLYARSPALAAQEAKKLSDSIKENKAASAQRHPNEPLSQIKPSTAGAGDGVLSIRDLRNQDWMKA